MTTEVTLRIEPLDYEDAALETILDAFPDFSFATSNGISLVTIFANTDPTAEGIDAVRALRAAGITVLSVFEDLVNTTEVAERAGVSRQAARKWTDRTDFPAPNACIGSDDQRVWTWAHVLQWLYDVKAYPQDEILPNDETVAAVNAFIHGVNGFQYAKNYTAVTPVAATRKPRKTPTVRHTWNVDLPTGAPSTYGMVGHG